MSADLGDAVRQVLPSVRADLERLVRIPSVSADPDADRHVWASAATTAGLLREAGLPEVDVVTAGNSRPAVLGRRPGPPGAPTVLLYAHHDVQPAGEPRTGTAARSSRPSATGGSTGAAPPTTRRAWWCTWPRYAPTARLPVGVTVLVEGEEEIGSPALAGFLHAFRDSLEADVVVLTDTGNWTRTCRR